MAATSSVLKPDYSAKQKHFIFTDEHEQLRETIRAFAQKELAPHADEWEETTFPDSVFHRMGELGLPGPRQARAVRRAGRRLLHGARARRGDRPRAVGRPGDGRRRPHRHGDAADPRVRHRGAEAGVGRARDQGREDPLPGHHRAGRRLRRRRHQDRARCKDGDEYVINGSQDVHHQRPPRRRHRPRHEDRPGRRLRRLHAVPRPDGRAGRHPREEAREARHALQRHRAARLPGRARARRPRSSARSARASTTSCGSSRASA